MDGDPHLTSCPGLVPLSDFISRLGLAGDHFSTPFDAVTDNTKVVVRSVLERTAVVHGAGGERRLVRQADISVDPLAVRWRAVVGRRRGSELIASHLPKLRRCPDCGRTPAQTRFYDLSRTYCSDCQRRRQRPERVPSPRTVPRVRLASPRTRREQKPARRLTESREGADRCRPGSCEVGSDPHKHCRCGLPMSVDAVICRWCDVEGFDPTPGHETEDGDALAWDGRRYPAWRRRRISAPDPEGLRLLLVAVLEDTDEDGRTAQTKRRRP